jgi:hypothetical protein
LLVRLVAPPMPSIWSLSGLPSTRDATASNCRTWPNVNFRRNEPSVEGDKRLLKTEGELEVPEMVGGEL